MRTYAPFSRFRELLTQRKELGGVGDKANGLPHSFHLTCAITPRVLPFTGVLPSNILSRKDSKSLTHLAMGIEWASRILIPRTLFFDVVSGVLNLYWDLQMCSYHGGNRRFQSTQ